MCIEHRWICDGSKDCSDGSDEMNCTQVHKHKHDEHRYEHGKCGSREWSCANNQCIHVNWRCDGSPDCDDGSDEVDCDNNLEDLKFKCQILTIIAAVCLVLAIGCPIVLHCCRGKKTGQSLNFENPVYQKTTEEQFALEKADDDHPYSCVSNQ